MLLVSGVYLAFTGLDVILEKQNVKVNLGICLEPVFFLTFWRSLETGPAPR